MDPTKVSVEVDYPTCSLPELYVSANNVTNERKKDNLMKIQGVTPAEAKKILSQNLKAIRGTQVTKQTQDFFPCEVVKTEKPESMSELLQHRLLTSSLASVERLSRSQKRLSAYGIPPLVHNFPYDILINYAKSLAMDEKKKVQGIKTGRYPSMKLSEKFIIEDKITPYLIIDPEKQFLDLQDLEWRYYKGVVKWKKPASNGFIQIKFSTEKRFVESKNDPEAIFLPLVHTSLLIFPKDNDLTREMYSKYRLY